MSHDGVSALAKARAGGFDLILLDLRMPGSSGFSSLIQLRGLRPDVPVAIVWSAAYVVGAGFAIGPAIAGALVFPLRKLGPKTLIGIGVAVLLALLGKDLFEVVYLKAVQTAVAAGTASQSISGLAAANANLSTLATALRLTGDELEFYNRTHGMSAEQVAKHGASIRALIVDMREEQGGLDALEASQKAYQQSTETMLDDLQRSWGNLFQELLRGGKITMRDLSSTVLDIWASTIARMSSMQMSNAFQSALTPSSGNTAAAVAGSGGSINWGQLAGVVGGGVSSVLSASMIKSSAPIYEGGQLISEGAKSLNLSLANLGTNMLAGYAGGKLGTMAGEAITGKTAQSNYGAMAGAVIGAFVQAARTAWPLMKIGSPRVQGI